MILSDCNVFENPPLPYAFDALEPYIDAETMRVHHDLYLQAYTDGLNALLRDNPRLCGLPLSRLLCLAPRLPEPVGLPLSRQAGGVYNHRLFFESMAPQGTGGAPDGALETAIVRAFGSPAGLRDALAATALSVFGSGYAWLAADGWGRLSVCTTPNQETPLPRGLCPVLNLDVWEHAYFLKHFNKRAAYVADWMNVINWKHAGALYAACAGAS